MERKWKFEDPDGTKIEIEKELKESIIESEESKDYQIDLEKSYTKKFQEYKVLTLECDKFKEAYNK